MSGTIVMVSATCGAGNFGYSLGTSTGDPATPGGSISHASPDVLAAGIPAGGTGAALGQTITSIYWHSGTTYINILPSGTTAPAQNAFYSITYQDMNGQTTTLYTTAVAGT